VAAVASLGASAAARSAPAASLCVGGKPECFTTIQAAVDAAQDGDTIQIGPGTFAGGIKISKSLELVGTSAAATTIRGGGPVLTIGKSGGVDQPTVSIDRLTITGGLNDSAPLPFAALGGGVWIPSGANNSTGATVSISNSVIAGNRAAPETTDEFCGFPCAFALGGGIFNAGTLTVTDTRITDNVSGSTGTDSSVASSAAGGAILNGFQGSLTLRRSFVTDNRAAVNAPNGRSTDGGGISNAGTLTIEDSRLSGNASTVAASVPSFFPSDVVEANAGGIYLQDGSSATIRRSQVSSNRVVASDTAGDVEAEAGGIDSDGSLLMIESSVDHNTANGSVPAGAGFTVEADGGGLQIQGVTTLRDSHIVANALSSISATGTAFGSGGGIFNLGATLVLERSVVTGNNAAATGLGGVNLGGGIANVQFFGPRPDLTLVDSVVTANGLAPSGGVASSGGGLFNLEVTGLDPFMTGSAFPITLTRTVIAGNKPDQCGC
jgi:hypothetical protein